MSKVDNYNKYYYDQALVEKHTGRRQYTIRDLSMRSGSEVELRGLEKRFSYEIGTRDLTLGG